jgi:hypothetical protein
MIQEDLDIVIKPKKSDSRWVALDMFDGDKIIAEGNEPSVVAEEARIIGKQFMLMFVPNQGETYIF